MKTDAVELNKKELPVLWTVWIAWSLGIFLLFVCYTQNVWEDFFITFKFSANFADGAGLTYDGETRVHGFTSFINTFLPSLFYWITGGNGHEAALFWYRLSGWVFLTWSLGLLLQHFITVSGCSKLCAGLAALLLLSDIKIVAFSYNGQEAAFMIGFLALAITSMLRGMDKSWLMCGLAWAGLMYTRPDSPIYITLLSLGMFAFPSHGRSVALRGIMKAAAVCALIYLPWFVFTWVYYGSPVPHTLSAKSGIHLPVDLSLFQMAGVYFHQVANAYSWVFCPVYVSLSAWHPLLETFSLLLAFIASFLWLFPKFSSLTRTASLAALGSGLYLGFIGLSTYQYPWYFPPFAFFIIVALVTSIPRIFSPAGLKIIRVAAVAVLLMFAFTFASGLYQLKWQTHYVENGIRKPLGLWLKENTAPGDSVYLECLGYIGYFSGARMLDFPGLSSPDVVRASKQNGRNFYRTMAAMQPDWIVLRERELNRAWQMPEISNNYNPRMVYNHREQIENHKAPALLAFDGGIPGAGYLLFDSTFFILEKIEKQSEIPEVSAGSPD